MAGSKHLKKAAKLKVQWLRSTGLIILVVLLAASLLLNLFQMAFPVVKYYGTGMEPALKDGQILLWFLSGLLCVGLGVGIFYRGILIPFIG